MAYNATRLTARSQATRFHDSAITDSALVRGLMRSRTRLSKLTGTANIAAQIRPSSAGDIGYLARGCRTAVASARDIDMTVLLGLISSTVLGLLEKMNA